MISHEQHAWARMAPPYFVGCNVASKPLFATDRRPGRSIVVSACSARPSNSLLLASPVNFTLCIQKQSPCKRKHVCHTCVGCPTCVVCILQTNAQCVVFSSQTNKPTSALHVSCTFRKQTKPLSALHASCSLLQLVLHIRGLLDSLDGSIARACHNGTPWGDFIDTSLDAIPVTCVLYFAW
jgi:hypothetical protein